MTVDGEEEERATITRLMKEMDEIAAWSLNINWKKMCSMQKKVVDIAKNLSCYPIAAHTQNGELAKYAQLARYQS